MDQGYRTKQSTDAKLLLLTEQQKLIKEGSLPWHDLQSMINQIIAENYLRYVNR